MKSLNSLQLQRNILVKQLNENNLYYTNHQEKELESPKFAGGTSILSENTCAGVWLAFGLNLESKVRGYDAGYFRGLKIKKNANIQNFVIFEVGNS